jgi:dTDP-4-amino-4,6-dideoxygalactose transaminase
VARKHGLLVIEDCAHAIEAEYRGTPAGLLGDAGCFSFYATKNLTTVEGGMVLTKDASVAAEIKTLANHGMSADAWSRFSDEGYRHYEVVRAGFKYNMADINAAIGLAQLQRVESHAARRKAVWRRYDEALSDLPCILPQPEAPDTRHARHLYTPLLKLESLSVTRDEVLDALTAEHIGAGVHFVPVHQHSYYRRFWKAGDFPNARFIGERTLSLPLAGDLSDEDVEDVIHAFRRILTHFSAPN